jgi:hypothetical protein
MIFLPNISTRGIFFLLIPKRGTKISEFLEDIKQDQQTILSLYGVDCSKAFLFVA